MILLFVLIYLVSLVGMWCFIHFYMQTANGSDLFITIFPAVNTVFVLVAIAYMLSELDWAGKITNKFFKL